MRHVGEGGGNVAVFIIKLNSKAAAPAFPPHLTPRFGHGRLLSTAKHTFFFSFIYCMCNLHYDKCPATNYNYIDIFQKHYFPVSSFKCYLAESGTEQDFAHCFITHQKPVNFPAQGCLQVKVPLG